MQGPVLSFSYLSAMRKYPLVIILLLQSLLIASNGVGGYPGGFLEMGFGGRNMALGNSGVATNSSPFSQLYNPALLLFNDTRFDIGMGYLTLPLDRRIYGFSASYVIKRDAAVGFMWLNSAIDNLWERDIDGYKTGEIANSENAFYFTFNKSIGGYISIGGSFKYVQATLYELSAYSVGSDVGIAARLFRNKLILGALRKNLGVKYPWDSGKIYEHGVISTESFPHSFELGFSYTDTLFIPFTLLGELQRRERAPEKFRAGIELTPIKYLDIRLGYNGDRINFGGGINYSRQGYNFEFNWAYIPSPLGLSPAQTFTLAFRF